MQVSRRADESCGGQSRADGSHGGELSTRADESHGGELSMRGSPWRHVPHPDLVPCRINIQHLVVIDIQDIKSRAGPRIIRCMHVK